MMRHRGEWRGRGERGGVEGRQKEKSESTQGPRGWKKMELQGAGRGTNGYRDTPLWN